MERTGFQCRISAIVVTASPSKLATKKAQIRLNLRLWRRERDSNPCPAINRLPHFEFFLLHGTWWKTEVISRLFQKIRTIEFTLKISSKSKITRLHADLNPLSKTQKNLPFGENRERFYARWRERAREIPGARIHPYNMLLLTLTKSKQQRMDEHENSVRVL